MKHIMIEWRNFWCRLWLNKVITFRHIFIREADRTAASGGSIN